MRLIYIIRTRFSHQNRRVWITKVLSLFDPQSGETDRHENRPSSSRTHIWSSFIIFVLLGLLKVYLDPFGIGTASSQHAQDTLMLAYLGPGYGDQRGDDSDVAVVLLRDRTLDELASFHQESDDINRELKEARSTDEARAIEEQNAGPIAESDTERVNWPVSMAMHTRILDAISIYQPKAIFVDILFLDQRGDDHIKTLRKFLLRHISRTGWPSVDAGDKSGPHIYFARSTRPSGDEEEPYVIRPDLYTVDCNEERNCKELSALLRAYLNRHLIPVPKNPERGIIRSYPVEAELWTKDSAETSRHTSKIRSAGFHFLPAFTLLDRLDLERKQGIAKQTEVTWRASDKNWGERALQGPEIVWNTRPHRINKKWMRCKCFDGDGECLKYRQRSETDGHEKQTISNSFLLRLWTAVFTPDALKQTCAPIATAPVEALLNWELDPDTLEEGDPYKTTDKDLRDILENKIVFYGADVTAAADLIRPPTHDRLPGVYMHAMAMDNLLAEGPSYLHRSGWSQELDALAIILLGLLYLGLRYYEREKGLQAPGQLLLALLYAGLCVVLVLCYIYLLTGWLRIAPIDWLGTLGLAFGLVSAWLARLAAPLHQHLIRRRSESG